MEEKLKNIIKKIEPQTIVEYLNANGWKLLERRRGYVKIFQRFTKDKFVQVTIPMDKTFGDYEEAMISAIETIAHAEGKEVYQLLSLLKEDIVEEIKREDLKELAKNTLREVRNKISEKEDDYADEFSKKETSGIDIHISIDKYGSPTMNVEFSYNL